MDAILEKGGTETGTGQTGIDVSHSGWRDLNPRPLDPQSRYVHCGIQSNRILPTDSASNLVGTNRKTSIKVAQVVPPVPPSAPTLSESGAA